MPRPLPRSLVRIRDISVSSDTSPTRDLPAVQPRHSQGKHPGREGSTRGTHARPVRDTVAHAWHQIHTRGVESRRAKAVWGSVPAHPAVARPPPFHMPRGVHTPGTGFGLRCVQPVSIPQWPRSTGGSTDCRNQRRGVRVPLVLPHAAIVTPRSNSEQTVLSEHPATAGG